MSRNDLTERMLASLYETMLDDSHWPTTSGLLDEACGSKGNMLVFGDGESQEDVDIFFARFCSRGQRREAWEREYFDFYHALDERIPRLRQLPDSQLVHAGSLYTEEEMKTSPAYNDALRRSDTQNSLNVRLDGPDRSRIVLTLADPIEGTGWSSAQVETIERLLPHLRQFVRVRQALVDAGALGSSLAMLLDNTRSGVIQLDRRGRIVAANDRARHLLRKGHPLADSRGHLHASSRDNDAEFQRLLARALPRFGGQGAGGSMAVDGSLISQRLVLHVSPVRDRETDLGTRRVAALVLVAFPGEWPLVDPQLVATTFGLTPVESQIAVLLAQGNSIHDIATATGRGVGTIRWHLKHIFSKNGISRQVELVRLVLSLTDMPQNQR